MVTGTKYLHLTHATVIPAIQTPISIRNPTPTGISKHNTVIHPTCRSSCHFCHSRTNRATENDAVGSTCGVTALPRCALPIVKSLLVGATRRGAKAVKLHTARRHRPHITLSRPIPISSNMLHIQSARVCYIRTTPSPLQNARPAGDSHWEKGIYPPVDSYCHNELYFSSSPLSIMA